ncbi:E3 ubiquitin-protein ligase MARCH5 [Clonorchis sinensis]|uniref:E3 ubiquitin-protein ligase MARCHF5 n=1 Tax=Clonorchis sinensis TaxID=79923 RepID=G7YWE4_CLOSI|nr:E3 ubiquitin-protein ligase MARCH5 [Clonorchis sinensis]
MLTGGDLDRVCWVCLESDLVEEPNGNWCRPCRCRGALKWVHHSCLQRWIDEQQSTRGQSSPVSCRACGAQYEIIYPPTSLFYLILETMDSRTRVLSYYLAGGLVIGSFYWSAVTYGAVTVMQVLGHQKGLQQMERMDPLILLLTLPVIPVGLLVAKAVPWENCLRSLWRQYISRLSFIRWLTCKAWPRWPMREGAVEPGPEGYEFPRLLCSALALPTIASMTGRLVFPRVRSDTHRLLLGGLTYLGIKGLLSVSYQEMRYMRTCHRMVKNYEGE